MIPVLAGILTSMMHDGSTRKSLPSSGNQVYTATLEPHSHDKIIPVGSTLKAAVEVPSLTYFSL
jgi:hypothetical protein